MSLAASCPQRQWNPPSFAAKSWKQQERPNTTKLIYLKTTKQTTGGGGGQQVLTYCLSITALAATCRVDNIASRSCFFSRIIASSSTLLYDCPPCPVLPLMGTGMGWGREGPEPGGPQLVPPRFPPPPPPAADMMAAAMLCVLGGKDAGKWEAEGGLGGNWC